jgi:lipid-binding SYLF domain-containing protein
MIMAALGAGLFGSTSLAALPALAQSASSAQPLPNNNAASPATDRKAHQVLAGAALAVKDMISQPHYNDLLARSRGMVIIPPMTEGTLGEHGQAVLVENTPEGWSQPAFLTLRRMSQGSNPTGKDGATIMLLMTNTAMDDFTHPAAISVGANGTLGVIDYSGQAKVPVSGGDVIVWSQQGGPALESTFHATDITADKSQDQTFYGKTVTVAQILNGGVTQKPAADALAGVLTP